MDFERINEVDNSIPHKMDLYTLIEKLKDIQSRCENDGKYVPVRIEYGFKTLRVYNVDGDDIGVDLDVKE